MYINSNRSKQKNFSNKRILLLESLLIPSLLWAAPTIACGSFAPRATPTPTQTVTVMQGQENQAQNAPSDTNTTNQSNTTNNIIATPLPIAPTVTPEPQPTPTFTSTPQAGTAITVGQPARVVAPYGLKLRASASAGAQLVKQLGAGQRINILDGPVSAEGYKWWKIEDTEGNGGWSAEGDGNNTWISPNVGGAQPVDRAPRVNERVIVTMPGDLQLTIRSLPGTNAPILVRVDSGTEFSVVDGPRVADDFTWFRIRSDDGNTAGWAAEADSSQTNRWLSPLE